MWQHLKLSCVSLGARLRYSLVVDEVVKKPNNQPCSLWVMKHSIYPLTIYLPVIYVTIYLLANIPKARRPVTLSPVTIWEDKPHGFESPPGRCVRIGPHHITTLRALPREWLSLRASAYLLKSYAHTHCLSLYLLIYISLLSASVKLFLSALLSTPLSLYSLLTHRLSISFSTSFSLSLSFLENPFPLRHYLPLSTPLEAHTHSLFGSMYYLLRLSSLSLSLCLCLSLSFSLSLSLSLSLFSVNLILSTLLPSHSYENSLLLDFSSSPCLSLHSFSLLLFSARFTHCCQYVCACVYVCVHFTLLLFLPNFSILSVTYTLSKI